MFWLIGRVLCEHLFKLFDLLEWSGTVEERFFCWGGGSLVEHNYEKGSCLRSSLRGGGAHRAPYWGSCLRSSLRGGWCSQSTLLGEFLRAHSGVVLTEHPTRAPVAGWSWGYLGDGESACLRRCLFSMAPSGGFGERSLAEDLVEVHELVGEHGPGGEGGWVEGFRWRGLANLDELGGVVRVCCVVVQSWTRGLVDDGELFGPEGAGQQGSARKPRRAWWSRARASRRARWPGVGRLRRR